MVPAKLVAVSVPPTPTPPVTTSAPVDVELDVVLLVRVTIPDAPMVVAPEIAPERVSDVRVPTEVILPWAAVVIVPAKLVAVSVPPTPTPPVTTSAPVDVELEAVESSNNTFPFGAHSACVLVRVTLVPATGALSIYTVAALVIVTLVLLAAIVAWAKELMVALAAVPEEAVLVFVYVVARELY